jgi:hypothetical protein
MELVQSSLYENAKIQITSLQNIDHEDKLLELDSSKATREFRSKNIESQEMTILRLLIGDEMTKF